MSLDLVRAQHALLSQKLRKTSVVPIEEVKELIDRAVDTCTSDDTIEDRDELRGVVRYWASYYSLCTGVYPDVDLDRSMPLRHPRARPEKLVDTAASLREIRQLGRSLEERRRPRMPQSLPMMLSRLVEHLPGAISEATRTQRRSAWDIAFDIAWVIEHDIVQFRELMAEQAAASRTGGLSELWVSAGKILDLQPPFYERTVRRNLLDKVNHWYFLFDEDQFDQLYSKAKADRSLGAEHLSQLHGVVLTGPTVKNLFLFDFALRNPHQSDHAQGRFLMPGQDGKQAFYPMHSAQVATARDTLQVIRNAVVASGVQDLGPLQAKLLSTGSSVREERPN